MPSFLADNEFSLLPFSGKGGVGKTSCAVATALKLAQAAPQSEFLLVSTDPAHSLADSLAGVGPLANLQVIELDAQECLAAFKRRHGLKLYAVAERGTFLDHSDISRFLELSIPGLDELMASLEIAGWLEARRYRTIIVDTAPTGHALRLLAMPALLQRWLGAMDALLAKHRYLKKLYCGSVNHDEIDAFLDGLARSAKQMQASFQDARHTNIVPVMLAEEMSLEQTGSLLAKLKEGQVPVTDIVVNRLVPQDGCPLCAEQRLHQDRILSRILGSEELRGYTWWGVPLYPAEVRGPESLRRFWEGVTPLAGPGLALETTLLRTPPHVEGPGTLPGQESLLFFAGKGGVGKTTLACATSLRLAQDSPSRRVLLVSTDPAHSLAACLEMPVGPEPRRICPGLTALEIDAEAEFRALKRLYSEELRSFLRSLLPETDLAFDREAMERLLDLSPPGLNEVMALTRVMDLCSDNHYHTLVLDCAPTGHLVRLLEMPELVDGWLKTFFGLFLKYKQLFRLPKVTQRLVEMSRALKRLRALLADPAQCGLYAVAVLTEMAFEETKDLLAACQRMRIHTPLLFLNQARPLSDCPLCSALRRRESAIQQKFRRQFPTTSQVLVYYCGQPCGLERLAELGQAIYAAPAVRALSYA